MTAEVELDGMLRRLHMPTVRRLWSDLQVRAETEGMRYADYLQVLVGEEIAHRTQTRISRMTHRAKFPFLRTIEEFDFAYQSGLRKELLGSYLGPEFVLEGRSLLLYGPSGVGKTHVAIAIAYKAIQHGSDARFVTAAHLIDELSSASRDGRLREALVPYTHPGVLVVDEVGYLSYGPDAANVLFQVVNERHLHRRPMVFTTNKPIEEWGRVLHDPDLAEAILDRVLERGRVLHFKGPSFRTRHLQSREGARISGKGGPEFQEPTPRDFFRKRAGPLARKRAILESAAAPSCPQHSWQAQRRFPEVVTYVLGWGPRPSRGGHRVRVRFADPPGLRQNGSGPEGGWPLRLGEPPMRPVRPPKPPTIAPETSWTRARRGPESR